MFRIRTAIAASMVLVVVFFVMAQDTAGYPKKLVGQWQFTKGDAPPGAVLEFTADGKFAMRFDLKGKQLEMKGTYTLQGDKLTTTVSLPLVKKSKSEEHTILKLTDTELHTKDEKGQVDELKRVPQVVR